ncbi:MAG: HAD-IIB family hydrolase [candidate division FCPU426 bacterium]
MQDFNGKKIIFADVDDTICVSTRPVEQDMALEIGRLVASGRVFGFVSGSTLEQLREQFEGRLKGDYHLLGVSGTAYAVVRDGHLEKVYQGEIPLASRKALTVMLRDFAARHGLVSLTNEADQIQDRVSQMTFSALGRHAPEPLKRAFDPEGSIRKAWAAELRGSIGNDYSVSVGGTTSIDITLAGMDKGWGIRKFLKYHGWRAEDAVFFGDSLSPGGNDFPARAVVDCVEVKDPADTLEKLRKIGAA